MDEHTYAVTLTVTVRGRESAATTAAYLSGALAEAARKGALHTNLSVSDLAEMDEDYPEEGTAE